MQLATRVHGGVNDVWPSDDCGVVIVAGVGRELRLVQCSDGGCIAAQSLVLDELAGMVETYWQYADGGNECRWMQMVVMESMQMEWMMEDGRNWWFSAKMVLLRGYAGDSDYADGWRCKGGELDAMQWWYVMQVVYDDGVNNKNKSSSFGYFKFTYSAKTNPYHHHNSVPYLSRCWVPTVLLTLDKKPQEPWIIAAENKTGTTLSQLSLLSNSLCAPNHLMKGSGRCFEFGTTTALHPPDISTRAWSWDECALPLTSGQIPEPCDDSPVQIIRVKKIISRNPYETCVTLVDDDDLTTPLPSSSNAHVPDLEDSDLGISSHEYPNASLPFNVHMRCLSSSQRDIGDFLVRKEFVPLYSKIWRRYGHIVTRNVVRHCSSALVTTVNCLLPMVVEMEGTSIRDVTESTF
ncbi:hypothetical protein C5167_006096 [Papaver somniferum]|uniref:Uncharacterized protein n=1 Tax=Papaver somniferum TaxID=3469 RepID=A0A4Y7JGL7_PAPSO|nr:hypothetical protein C5167_006096 [Papaver somniferum]